MLKEAFVDTALPTTWLSVTTNNQSGRYVRTPMSGNMQLLFERTTKDVQPKSYGWDFINGSPLNRVLKEQHDGRRHSKVV